MTLEYFLSLFDQPRTTSRGFIARCPAHSDRSPSLSIAESDDGKILLHCFSGCSTEEVVESLGLKLSDLFADARPDPSAIRKAQKRKTLQAATSSVEISRSEIYLDAARVIEAASGIDISAWNTDQLDLAMNAMGEARLLLIREEREGEF